MQAMLVEKYREKARSEVACAPAADNFKIYIGVQADFADGTKPLNPRGSIITSPKPEEQLSVSSSLLLRSFLLALASRHSAMPGNEQAVLRKQVCTEYLHT